MFELLFSEYRPILQDVFAWTLCCAALVWGGAPERIIAASWLLLFEIGTSLHSLAIAPVRQVGAVDWYFAGLDLIGGAIWIMVALYANRNYPLWIAGMQVLAMSAHLARGISEAISPVAYATMVIAPGYFQLIFLAIGLTRHVRRKRKYGRYRDWRILRNPPAFLPSLNRTNANSGWPDFTDSARSWRDQLK